VFLIYHQPHDEGTRHEVSQDTAQGGDGDNVLGVGCWEPSILSTFHTVEEASAFHPRQTQIGDATMETAIIGLFAFVVGVVGGLYFFAWGICKFFENIGTGNKE
jgi:hypothetical protein